MYERINEASFVEAMIGKGYSYNGCVTLFRYLEELEEGDGQGMEFDPVGINCDWSEYTSPCDAVRDLISPDAIEEDGDDSEALAMLEKRTTVLPVLDWREKPTGNILVMAF